mmetsp:Transcript_9476/g.14298  ORF Transcript_9476/g.14298 Transcript_9476/m.14298 type:complete len:91 (+) Transcript_9476:188-460(+)
MLCFISSINALHCTASKRASRDSCVLAEFVLEKASNSLVFKYMFFIASGIPGTRRRLDDNAFGRKRHEPPKQDRPVQFPSLDKKLLKLMR